MQGNLFTEFGQYPSILIGQTRPKDAVRQSTVKIFREYISTYNTQEQYAPLQSCYQEQGSHRYAKCDLYRP
jgi:hypothetical protein